MSITLPKGINIPQEGPLSQLLSSLGTGFSKGAETSLAEKLKTHQQQQKMQQAMSLYQKLRSGQNDGISPPGTDGQQSANIPSAEAVATMTLLDPNLGRAMGQERKEGLRAEGVDKKLALEERKVDLSESKKYRDKIEEVSDSLPDRELSLIRVKDAMKDPKELKNFQNYWADYMESKGLPGEYFRNSAAASLRSATKELLISDIGKIGGTAARGKFIQKELASSYPKAGDSPLARKKILLAQQTGLDLMKKEVAHYHRIADEYRKRGKGVPGDINRLVKREFFKDVSEAGKQLEEKFKELNKYGIKGSQKAGQQQKEGYTLMSGGPGKKPSWILNNRVNAATQAGWSKVNE